MRRHSHLRTLSGITIRPILMMALVCAALGGVVTAARLSTPGCDAFALGFPRELVEFTPDVRNPLFTGAGPGHWDARIRERGWIMHDDDGWHLWYTGYDGTNEGVRQLGYATSTDGITWQRHLGNPLLPGVWVEDMMVVRHGDTYYMFAEGEQDRAHLLTSTDRVHWHQQGTLDIRRTDGRPLSPGPFGTPTAWFEDGLWYLCYERMDAGIWLATSRDMKVWTNVRDEPVLVPGPDEHDEYMIALNQVIKHDGRYFAIYHGTGGATATNVWNTNVAQSDDLLHWRKYPLNPVIRDKSSGQVLHDGTGWRLYTTHESVDLFHSR
jgi:hypothetical protein